MGISKSILSEATPVSVVNKKSKKYVSQRITSKDCCAFGNDMIGGKADDNKTVTIYISNQCRKYKLNIPTDICILCASFFTNTWTISLDGTFGKSKTTFPISGSHNLYEMQADFEYGPYVCSLIINKYKKQYRTSNFPFKFDPKYFGIYTHLLCEELDFERKFTQKFEQDYYTAGITKFGFGKVPQHSVTFTPYFQIIPMVNNSYKKNKSNCSFDNEWKEYHWDLSSILPQEPMNKSSQCWYSPNFYNEGCLCLSLQYDIIQSMDIYGGPVLTKKQCIIQTHLLKNPMGQCVKINRKFKLYDVNGGCYESEECTVFIDFIAATRTQQIIDIPITETVSKIEMIFMLQK